MYKLNDKQKIIIERAFDNDNNISHYFDLELKGVVKKLTDAADPYVPIYLVNDYISRLRLSKNFDLKNISYNDKEEIRNTYEYTLAMGYRFGNIEMHSMSIFFEALEVEDDDIKDLAIFIHHLARVGREKMTRGGNGSEHPGTDMEFEKALKLAKRFRK